MYASVQSIVACVRKEFRDYCPKASQNGFDIYLDEFRKKLDRVAIGERCIVEGRGKEEGRELTSYDRLSIIISQSCEHRRSLHAWLVLSPWLGRKQVPSDANGLGNMTIHHERRRREELRGYRDQDPGRQSSRQYYRHPKRLSRK